MDYVFKEMLSLRFTIAFGLLATLILGDSSGPIINTPPTLRIYRDWKINVNEAVGNKVTLAEASDDDGDPILFYIKPKEDGGVFPDASKFFRINSETGEIYLNSSLKGKEGKYLLYVTADDGHLGQTTEVLVEILNSVDRGSSRPKSQQLSAIPTAIPFNSKQVNIETINIPPTLIIQRDWKIGVNETVGNRVAVAEAYDDDGDPIKFYIKPKEDGGVFPDASKFFTMNSETGEVYLNSSLKGKDGKYLLYVIADDGHLGQTTEVLVEIVKKFGGGSLRPIPLGLPPPKPGSIRFPMPHLQIAPVNNSGQTLPASTLNDLMTNPTMSSIKSKINIAPINIPPSLIIQRDWKISVDETVGNIIAIAEATDDDEDPIKFYIKPKEDGGVFPDASMFFRIDSETGEIYLNRSLNGKDGKYLLYVIADDGHLQQKTEVFVDVVNQLSGESKRPILMGSPSPRPNIGSLPVPQFPSIRPTSGQIPLTDHNSTTKVLLLSNPTALPTTIHIEKSVLTYATNIHNGGSTSPIPLATTTSAAPATVSVEKIIENFNNTVPPTYVINIQKEGYTRSVASTSKSQFLPIASSRAPPTPNILLTNQTTRAVPTIAITEESVENITVFPTYDGRPTTLNNSDNELIPSINITETQELPSNSNNAVYYIAAIAIVFIGIIVACVVNRFGLTKRTMANKNFPSDEDVKNCVSVIQVNNLPPILPRSECVTNSLTKVQPNKYEAPIYNGKNCVSVIQVNNLPPILPRSECVTNSLTKVQPNKYEAPICTAGDRASIYSREEEIQVDSKWEFPRNKLKTINIIGEGCYGRVWKAEVQDMNNVHGVTIVAVKTLKDNAAESDKKDILSELEIMKMLDPHPNIIRLLGCCTEKDPPFVIMEFAALGTLQTYLRDSRSHIYYKNLHGGSKYLTSKDLTSFAYHVAKGMEYLSSKNIIHRDLAARNVLVGADHMCKVADFGFARNVVLNGIYQKKSDGGLPIRWMAPECLYDNIFSTPGDVWSFGILLWEIVMLGATPYPGISAMRVIKAIRDGYRLEKPKHCKRKLYSLMFYCWNMDQNDRPSFSEIAQVLEELLLEDIEYIKLHLFPEHTYYNVFISGDLERV